MMQTISQMIAENTIIKANDADFETSVTRHKEFPQRQRLTPTTSLRKSCRDGK